MDVRADLQGRLLLAMRHRDSAVVAHLRSALAAIDNAEAAPADTAPAPADSTHFAGARQGLAAGEVDRNTITEEERRAIVADEVAELSIHVERLITLCRHDEADAARRAVAILNEILGPRESA